LSNELDSEEAAAEATAEAEKQQQQMKRQERLKKEVEEGTRAKEDEELALLQERARELLAKKIPAVVTPEEFGRLRQKEGDQNLEIDENQNRGEGDESEQPNENAAEVTSKLRQPNTRYNVDPAIVAEGICKRACADLKSHLNEYSISAGITPDKLVKKSTAGERDYGSTMPIHELDEKRKKEQRKGLLDEVEREAFERDEAEAQEILSELEEEEKELDQKILAKKQRKKALRRKKCVADVSGWIISGGIFAVFVALGIWMWLEMVNGGLKSGENWEEAMEGDFDGEWPNPGMP
jgi:hypothetical protein